MKRFDYEDLFCVAVQEGLSLFCGAGFSVEAEDRKGEKLPVGAYLLDELKKQFSRIERYSSLPKACTTLKKSDKNSFYRFLEERFTIGKFDSDYNIITKIKIKNIYTTNIDDLFFNIYSTNESAYYLNDRSRSGNEIGDSAAIGYFPLHGCVKNKGDYVFGLTDIASAYSQSSHTSAWKQLAKDASGSPILFWGWNFEDSGPIEAMYGEENGIDSNIHKWVLLYEPTDETIDCLTTLGFNIIIGNTKEMLRYLIELDEKISKREVCPSTSSDDSFCNFDLYLPPKNDDNLKTYPLKSMFLDYAPQWSYIYSGSIPKTKYYRVLVNEIIAGKNLLVYGIRGSGKTTLMMQLLIDFEIPKAKHFMTAPSLGQAKVYIKDLKGRRSLLFVDDCFRDTEAVVELRRQPNIQIVAFDRDFNYESQFVKLKDSEFSQPIEITELSQEDAQAILDIIPEDLKKNNANIHNFSKDPTIPNLLAGTLKLMNFNFVERFQRNDAISAEVFILICYVHSCGVPCSFDMIYSYLGDKDYAWPDMLEIIKRVGGLIRENSIGLEYYDIDPEAQDYYECRSRFFAEKILGSLSLGNQLMAEVLMKFAENVPLYKICRYDKFKKSGYDADLAGKAFLNIEDGETYYNICRNKDRSEYIYQQAALYFSKKGAYKKAFEWIDKARNLTHYNHFSIDSTYAKIYFDVNVKAAPDLAVEALYILNECCMKDERKAIHFLSFAKCVMEFVDNHGTDNLGDLLPNALKYVQEGLEDSNFALSKKNKYELRKIKNRLEKICPYDVPHMDDI